MSPGTWGFPFFSSNYVGRVSGVNSGVFFTGIESIGDVVLFVMFLPRGFESKVVQFYRIILVPKILNFSPSFKITFNIIVVLCLYLAHYIRCSFTNIMPRRDPVGAIHWPSDSGSGNEDRPQCICCGDGRQPKINEVWNFGEDVVTPEVHMLPIVLLQPGVGSLCLAGNLLMEASSGSAFLTF